MERSYGAAAFEFIGDQCGNGRSNLVEMTRKKFSVEKVEIGRTGSKLAAIRRQDPVETEVPFLRCRPRAADLEVLCFREW